MARARAKYEYTAEDKTDRALRSVRRNVEGVDKAMSGLKTAIGSVVGIAGLGLLVRGAAQTTIQFEQLQASLRTVTGSAENAEIAFNALTDFTARTPFQLQEVVQGFIKLKSLGLTPTEESLESFGNTASAMGKTLNQFVEAVADATTGEFERLKEFGIKARSEGDRVRFTFQGTTTEIGKNAEEIEQFLIGLGQNQFAGAMEEQMKTLGGAISNTKDAISLLEAAIGEAGLSASLKEAAGFVRNLANDMRDLTDAAGEKGLTSAMRNLFGVLVFGTGSPEEQFGRLSVRMDQLLEKEQELMSTIREEQDSPFRSILGNAEPLRKELQLVRSQIIETRAAMEQLEPAVFGVFNAPKKAGGGKGLADLVIDGEDSGAGGGKDSGEKKISKTQERINSLIGTLQKQRDTLGLTAEQVKAYELSLLGADEATIKLAEDLAREIQAYEDKQDALEEVRDANEAARREEERLAESLRSEGLQVFRDTRTELEIYNMEMQRLDELLQAGAIDAITYGRAQEQLKEELRDANKETEKSNELAKELGFTFQSAFEDAVIGGESFRNVLQGIFEDIQRIILRKSVTEPLANSLGGFFDGFDLSSIFSGGGSGGSSNIVAGEFDEINKILFGGGFDIPKLPGFAHGGRFKVGGSGGTDSQLVAFRASPDETVSVSRPGQGGVVVNVYNQGNNEVQANSRTGRDGTQIVDVTVLDSMMRLKRKGQLDPLFAAFGGKRQPVLG